MHVQLQDIALRLQPDGGAALFIDYGPGASEGPPSKSVRGITKHGFCSFLERPGRIDVTVRACCRSDPQALANVGTTWHTHPQRIVVWFCVVCQS